MSNKYASKFGSSTSNHFAIYKRETNKLFTNINIFSVLYLQGTVCLLICNQALILISNFFFKVMNENAPEL